MTIITPIGGLDSIPVSPVLTDITVMVRTANNTTYKTTFSNLFDLFESNLPPIPSLPVSLANGGTGVSLTAVNNAVFSTNGSGVSQLSTTLPSGLTIPGYATTSSLSAYLPLTGGTLSGSLSVPSLNINTFALSIAGNTSLIGAFTFAGTLTGNTAVTYPTTGTLATTTQLPTPSALTKTDDTNVTLTLGGSPSTALLNAASITVGWTGQASVPRGGTGSASFTAYSVICGGTTSTGAFQNAVGVGTANQVFLSNGAGALPSWQTIPGTSSAALTKTNDTNVTLTLGGAPTTALLSATSLTLGWTGTLGISRGGLNSAGTPAAGRLLQGTGSAWTATVSTFPGTATANNTLMMSDGVNWVSSTATYPPSAGVSGSILQSQGAGTGYLSTTAGYPSVIGAPGTIMMSDTGYSFTTSTATYPSTTTAKQLLYSSATNTIAGLSTQNNAVLVTDSSGNPSLSTTLPSGLTIPGAALTKTDDTNVTLTLGGAPTTALLTAASLTLGWAGQLGLTRGGSNASLTASNGGVIYSTASAMAVLAGTATAGQMFRSGASAAPSWSTATYPSVATGTGSQMRADGTNWVASTTTYPDTNAINTIPYASSANIFGSIAAANSGVLITSAGGVPSISSTLPSAVQNNITAVNSAANTLSIGGSTKTFVTGAVNVSSDTNVGSWSPGISFGGGVVGLTYSFQSGQYSTTVMPNGNILTQCWGSVGLSAKGSSTGSAFITGFPTTAGTSANIYIFACAQENTSTAGGAAIFGDMGTSATAANLRFYQNGSANTTMTNAHFTNTSVLKFYVAYWNN